MIFVMIFKVAKNFLRYQCDFLKSISLLRYQCIFSSRCAFMIKFTFDDLYGNFWSLSLELFLSKIKINIFAHFSLSSITTFTFIFDQTHFLAIKVTFWRPRRSFFEIGGLLIGALFKMLVALFKNLSWWSFFDWRLFKLTKTLFKLRVRRFRLSIKFFAKHFLKTPTPTPPPTLIKNQPLTFTKIKKKQTLLTPLYSLTNSVRKLIKTYNHSPFQKPQPLFLLCNLFCKINNIYSIKKVIKYFKGGGYIYYYRGVTEFIIE